ncbi:hypothetical protein DICA4_D27886 [Diutina catenulata]
MSIRLIYDKPDIHQSTSFEVYRRSLPLNFSHADNDDPVLFGCCQNLTLVLALAEGETVQADPMLQRHLPRCAGVDVYVLNHAVVVWFPNDGSEVGIEIPYSQLVLSGFQPPDELLLHLDGNSVVSVVSHDTEPSATALAIAGAGVESLYEAIVQCAELVGADDDDDDDPELFTPTSGSATPTEWVSTTVGSADDLDEGPQGEGVAGMCVDVGYASVAGTKRQPDGDGPWQKRRAM